MIDTDRCLETARRAALAAGHYIASHRPSRIDMKAGASSKAAAVVTDVDHTAEALIVDELAPTLNEFALLSEEREDDGGRHRAPAFWCVDPLDGTLPFVEGRPGFSVSVALVSRVGESLVGAVFDPVTGVLWSAARGRGATRDGVPLSVGPDKGSLSVFADPSFVDERLDALGRPFSVQHGAGAVINACLVVDNAPGFYLKRPKRTEGGGCLWDFAATACIAREAGAFVSDAYGHPLQLNAENPFMNERGVLYASHEELWRALVRR